jgi:hypothetical protein
LKEYFNTKHIEYNFIKHNEEVRLWKRKDKN